MTSVYLGKRPAFDPESPFDHHVVRVGNVVYDLQGIIYKIVKSNDQQNITNWENKGIAVNNLDKLVD